MNGIRNNKGITLIELLVVVSIIGILAGALAFSFQGWSRSYNVENQMKQLHADLMNARAKAMQYNRMHFMELAAGQYATYDDNNMNPDGDGNADPDTDEQLSQVTLDTRYPITWSGDEIIQFDTRGFANNAMTICSNSDADTDYNCINISATRIKLGQLSTLITDGGACNADNCVEK